MTTQRKKLTHEERAKREARNARRDREGKLLTRRAATFGLTVEKDLSKLRRKAGK